MASAPLSIANLALINLGATPLVSIDDGSRQADLLNAVYEPCRDYVLREHPWKCAIKRMTLSPLPASISTCYAFTYNQPSDLLRVVANDDDLFEFQIEGKKILAQCNPIECRYVWRVTDVSVFDAHLVEVMAWYIAKKIGFALTQASAVINNCKDEYAKSLSRAKFIDASTNRALKQKQDFFVDARYQGNHR